MAHTSIAVLIGLFVTACAGTRETAAEPKADEKFERFSKLLTGSTLVGHFTVLGKEDAAPEKEEYHIESVTKTKKGDTWLFKKALGPTAARLGTKPDSLPNLLGPPYYEVGIIAGNASFNPISSNMIPGEDDGVVAVEATKLEGMRDFLVLNTSHTMMRRDPEVAAETLHFLKHGRFSRSSMKRDG